MTADTTSKKAPCGGGFRAVAQALRDLATTQQAAVLAVVVETSGSTYRKPGAMIVLDITGVRVGALSGGCLEADLERAARYVLGAGEAHIVLFDTTGDEDRIFGSGTGCGGSMRVLVLPLPPVAAPLREAILDADRNGSAIHLALCRDAALIGCGKAVVSAATGDAREYPFDAHGVARRAQAADAAMYEFEIARTPRVLVCGAGPETPALVAMARLLGWHVELAEHRSYWRRFTANVECDCVHDGGMTALPSLLAARSFDAALVMTHNFDHDAQCLVALAASTPGFIGLLGPAARRDELLREVGEEIGASLGSRLHAPIGLALGGQGAEAIALSIVAGLQQYFSKGLAHARKVVQA